MTMVDLFSFFSSASEFYFSAPWDCRLLCLRARKTSDFLNRRG